MRADLPWIAALHPLNAVAISWLAFAIGMRSVALLRQPAVSPAPASELVEETAG